VIFNNCEFDHADIYPDLEAVKTSFRRLINIIPSEGKLIAGWDDRVVRELSRKAFCPVESFGLCEDAQWRAEEIDTLETSTHFTLWNDRTSLGDMEIPLAGNFNVKNVLAAIVYAQDIGINMETIRSALRNFKNVKRRLEVRGTVKNITLFDDFAHHPTAIQETLTAVSARFPKRRIWAIFEPRSATSRRNIFQKAFSESFDAADRVVIASAYAPEKLEPSTRLDVGRLVADLNKRGVQAVEWSCADEIIRHVTPQLMSGDLIVVMSNGGFDGIHEKFLKTLHSM
jgi:UDP-N-acetylmuramate: L-alanyl-gamma-D-glutamyl-meso-diaminopimelate ligase